MEHIVIDTDRNPPVDYELDDEVDPDMGLHGFEAIRDRAAHAREWAAERAEAAKEIVTSERELVTVAFAGVLLAGIAVGYLIGRIDGDRQTMRAFRAIRHNPRLPPEA